MSTNLATSIHRDTTRMDIHVLVKTLNENVGTAVVQAMTGTKNRNAPREWAKAVSPRPEAEARLRLGYRAWRTIESSDGADVALAWLVGANPRLGERTPVTAIREQRAEEVMAAAQSFVEDAHVA